MQDVGKEIHAYFGRMVVGVKLEDLFTCGFIFSKGERKPGWSCGRKSPFQFGKTSHFPPGLEERMPCSQLSPPANPTVYCSLCNIFLYAALRSLEDF